VPNGLSLTHPTTNKLKKKKRKKKGTTRSVKEDIDVFSNFVISRILMSTCIIRLFAFGCETLFPVEKRPWHTEGCGHKKHKESTRAELSGEGNRSKSLQLNDSQLFVSYFPAAIL
jgi:hypothetical protein